MKNTLLISAGIFTILCSSGVAQAATSVNCVINPSTGLSEATSPWRNALGRERADGICKDAAPAKQMQAAAIPPNIPTFAPVYPANLGVQVGQAMPSAPPLGIQNVAAATAGQIPAQRYTPVAAPMLAPAMPPTQYVNNIQAPVSSGNFAVLPNDLNFRTVLTRWARQEGWVFNPEHWTINKDIPVGGAEAMNLDFKGSVRRLLNSTLMLDTPVKPCFYSNRVLRVVPETEACNRSKE